MRERDRREREREREREDAEKKRLWSNRGETRQRRLGPPAEEECLIVCAFIVKCLNFHTDSTCHRPVKTTAVPNMPITWDLTAWRRRSGKDRQVSWDSCIQPLSLSFILFYFILFCINCTVYCRGRRSAERVGDPAGSGASAGDT